MSAQAVPAIRPRRVSFDWTSTPLHWVPDDPFTTHVINVLHLLLPAGERWFCNVYRTALPLIDEPESREQVKGFIGQEAVHARAHQAVLDHLREHGLDASPYTRRLDVLFERVHLGGSHVRRVLAMLRVAVAMNVLWVLGVWFLMRSDPTLDGSRPRWRDFWRSARRGRAPPPAMLAAAAPRYLRRDHHPSQEGSIELALDYLAHSPAARAAA